MSTPDRFVQEEAFKQNLALQSRTTHRTLDELGKRGVGPERMKKVEFFFYSNKLTKVQELVRDLKQLGYDAEARASASGDGTFIATGWTQPVSMAEDAMVEWTERMCTLGYQRDCDFDGWGTNLD
ncbi:MAG: ribonuclease E inhibitor RraB [Flavobacteriales bacterium]|nr:ribonuclease E inhibitor RraB [Flavobacteriales bacterium]